MDWETLKTECLACTRCGLCSTRTNVVFGQGVQNAEVLFVGEGPGQSEDEQGLPFVGRSGQLLDKYLFAIDLDRSRNCYIANIVKCRPPQNRDPQPEESEACMPWLREQFRLLQPKIVVCLGRIAAQRMIRKDFSVTKEHGQFIEKNGILFMFNGVMDLLSYLTSSSQLFGGFRLMGIAVAVDVVYLIAYYIWEHSAD